MTHDEKLYQDALAYFECHLSHNVTAEELAAALCVSKATLFRCFQKYAGKSVHRSFLERKIQRATQLLRSGCSVAETAERLGFSSPSYFSARYKRETGLNPSNIKP